MRTETPSGFPVTTEGNRIEVPGWGATGWAAPATDHADPDDGPCPWTIRLTDMELSITTGPLTKERVERLLIAVVELASLDSYECFDLRDAWDDAEFDDGAKEEADNDN